MATRHGFLFALALLLCTRLTAAPAWSYFHPIWKDGNPDAQFARLLGDPEGRIEYEFQIPQRLQPRVLFWTQVYGRFTSRTRIIHDKRNPGVTLGHIDFNPLYVARMSPFKRERAMNQLQQQILVELKRRLLAAWNGRGLAVTTHDEMEDWRHFLKANNVNTDGDLFLLLSNLRTQSGQRDKFEDALGRSSQLLPEMEKIFREKGLPVGLARIPFVESSFNTKAESKAGAVGIWQFTRRTAKAYIDPKNKKRWSDPMAQTLAAAKWLKRYRRALPDWGSTITSYNSGTGRVGKMVKNHKVRNAEQLLHLEDSKQQLGFAGLNFYSEVLAANLVEAYKTRIFVPGAITDAPAPPEATFYTPSPKPNPLMAAPSLVPWLEKR